MPATSLTGEVYVLPARSLKGESSVQIYQLTFVQYARLERMVPRGISCLLLIRYLLNLALGSSVSVFLL